MTEREALKLALEALEAWETGCGTTEYLSLVEKAVTDIKEVLAQPEQKPVAWMEGESVYWHTNPSLNDWIRANGTPLYTTPPQRTLVGLTDDEVIKQANKEQNPESFARGVLWAEA